MLDRAPWFFLLLALAAGPASAHKLKVYAFVTGRSIEGSVYFAGGSAAPGASVQIKDASGQTLAELAPDADGRFNYRAPSPSDITIVASSPDGHRATWQVAASAFAPTTGNAPMPIKPQATPSPVAARDCSLEDTVEAAVARQVQPLREELIAMRDEVRLHDVLGGIGYIFGLTGLALWWHRRRP